MRRGRCSPYRSFQLIMRPLTHNSSSFPYFPLRIQAMTACFPSSSAVKAPITSDEDGQQAVMAWMRKGKRSEEHTSELQSRPHVVCRLPREKKKQWAAGDLVFQTSECTDGKNHEIAPHAPLGGSSARMPVEPRTPEYRPSSPGR